jgi:hypothetical protein
MRLITHLPMILRVIGYSTTCHSLPSQGLRLHRSVLRISKRIDRDRTGFRYNQVYRYLQHSFAVLCAHIEYYTT